MKVETGERTLAAKAVAGRGGGWYVFFRDGWSGSAEESGGQ